MPLLQQDMLPCSVWANRKNAVACFLTPERKTEETANTEDFWDVKPCPLVIPAQLLAPRSHLEIAVEKEKNPVSIKTGATHSNRWTVHVARASPNFLSNIKSYFIALSNNWDSFILLGCYAAYDGSCLPTFRIVYRSHLQVSMSPRRMRGNKATNQATTQRRHQLTNQPTNQPKS
jgi:hypothetical protein